MIWIASGVPAVALGACLFLRGIPAQPRQAIQTAQTFVGFLQTHEWEKAYRLTTQKGEIGKSVGEFQSIVNQQLPEKPMGSVQFLAVSPFQSYGNRLRRWIGGREVEPKELRMEFSINGIPFEVREMPTGNGEWKVSYFQSHAG